MKDANEASEDNKNHWARDNMPPESFKTHRPQPIYRHVDDVVEDVIELVEEVIHVEGLLEKVEEELLN